MKHKYIYLLLTLLFSISTAYAQTGKGSVADVAFIQGNWKAITPDGRTIEGSWLPPHGENILGFMRMMKGDKPDLYEILAYEQTDKGLTSMVKHFQPGLIGSEEKDKQDRYVFVEATKGRAIFQKEGEETLRILYEKRSANQFVIARGSEQDGKWVFVDLFVFNRVK
ncbi:hypothetical protein IM792_18190 [Mucilaginibacter sp. JRF]|uniref:DUF6265 family protein n=1 Tax=Mucilaginibacter sp. JRF TaxID=2780088 RepID=UPI00187F1DB0|nr:DUF6265 family protein [Mucilaginibacter sp. JRF]MBE9586389.1 hypothetical protein [Mucilaginibacter sp. JRF]